MPISSADELTRGNRWLAVGAASGLMAVAAGAFAAHALKARLPAQQLAVFEVAARYQMYHALLQCLIGVLGARTAAPLLSWCGGMLLAGTILFSGSLYALALSGQRFWGAVTPLGGVCFLIGWALLFLHALRRPA